MDHVFPPESEAGHRARAIERLRRAVDNALHEGEDAARASPSAAVAAQPLFDRLADIGRELDGLRVVESGWGGREAWSGSDRTG